MPQLLLRRLDRHVDVLDVVVVHTGRKSPRDFVQAYAGGGHPHRVHGEVFEGDQREGVTNKGLHPRRQPASHQNGRKPRCRGTEVMGAFLDPALHLRHGGTFGIEGHAVHVCGLGIRVPKSGHRSEDERRDRFDAFDLADSIGHRLPVVHPYAGALLKDQHMGRGLQDLSHEVFLHPRHHTDHDHEGADAHGNAAQRDPGDEGKEAAATLGRQVSPGDVPLQPSTRMRGGHQASRSVGKRITSRIDG